MNKVTRNSELTLPKVTTGPLPASTQGVSSPPDGFPDVRVPLREIALTEKAGEPPFRTYDPSGPYTDAAAEIDVTRGLPRPREAWISERGGVEQYEGREVKPEDNGNVSARHLARDFAEQAAALPRSGGQARHAARIRARRHRHQGDGLRRPPREPRPRRPCSPAPRRRWPTATASAPTSRRTSRPSSCAPRSPAAAPSSRPTSTTASWSR